MWRHTSLLHCNIYKCIHCITIIRQRCQTLGAKNLETFSFLWETSQNFRKRGPGHLSATWSLFTYWLKNSEGICLQKLRLWKTEFTQTKRSLQAPRFPKSTVQPTCSYHSQTTVGARMAQWWEHSPPTNVALVQILASTPHVGWVCCWFSPLPWHVFLRVLRFSSLLINQHFQIPTRSGISRQTTLLWMCYL